MPAEILRRLDGAPALAGLRGRIQADILAGLPAHFRRLRWGADQLRAWQRDRLRHLLAQAGQRSAFHARRLRGVDPERFELADLPSLPIMTKTQMMTHFDELVSDRRLTREAAERALAGTGTEPRPLPGGYLCMATGGSSGHRGIFAYDRASVAEFVSLIFRTRLAALGVAALAPGPGGPGGPAGPVQLPEVTFAMVGASSAVHGTAFVPSMLAGTPVRFTSVPVTLPLPEIIARLNRLQATGLFGYPSMLARLAAEQEAGQLKIAPRLVNCTAETLQPEFRAAISRAFGAPVYNTFATTEGLAGSSGPDDPVITLATDSCIVELVDEGYEPVPPGTASAKVLVTNLYNHVQPLIRYELSDSFTRQADVPAHGHLRVSVEGRADDILHYASADVHPLTLRSVLLAQPDVLDYQVRQTARGIAVQVLPERETDLAPLGERLRTALARAGLADPDVTVEAVAALPRHPETGKLRRVIPA
ncbi:MAG TPA: AMP-binding protein [Streptosporangiaceae bacterium]|nr:AMP-binding protein [Streptosporangiaceae bacterium]